jgi:hypothetical protein
LLADLGADVVKVEPPHGDPLRWWGPFPGDRVDPDASGLFPALNTSKRNVHASLSESTAADTFLELVRGADLVVESLGPGTLERLELGPSELSAATDSLVVVRISVAGQHGPYRARPFTDLTLQAMGAGSRPHRLPGRSRVRVGGGGRLAELTVGSFAAAAALTAAIAARDLREQVVVDVSMLECPVGTLAYPLGLSPPDQRHATLPAIVRARDGWVGINCLTGQHWQDVCAMVGLDESPVDVARRRGCRRHRRARPALSDPGRARRRRSCGLELLAAHGAILLRRRAGGGLSAARSAVATERHPGRPAHPAPHLGGHTHPSWSPRAESTGESPRGGFGAEFAGSPRAESTGESARGVRDHLAFAGLRVMIWARSGPGRTPGCTWAPSAPT